MSELGFRHGDPRFPFFWETADQPAARWHGNGEGPVQYLADTPDGAWAEFLRHEEIVDVEDLAGIRRRIWAVELPNDLRTRTPGPGPIARGGPESHLACQEAARLLRDAGATMLEAKSAALTGGGARGQATRAGLREADDRDGVVWAIIGPRSDLTGWATVDVGAPPPRVLGLVNHFPGTSSAQR